MLEIPGIDPKKVEIHGKEFLKLVREAHHNYEAMMQGEEDGPQDPNHQNIIVLSSDDEFDDGNELDDFEGDDESAGERSHFFKPSPEVIAMNARSKSNALPEDQSSDQFLVSQLAPAPPAARAQSYDNSKSRDGRSARGNFRGRWKGKRKVSGDTGKGKASAGVTKRKSTSSRSSGSSFGGGAAKRGAFRGGQGGGGIGMMPT